MIRSKPVGKSPERHGRYSDLLETTGIAHELGNLIQIASSAINIIVRRSEAAGEVTRDPAVCGAKESLDRAGALVRQALQKTHRVETEVETVDIARCLTNIGTLINNSWAPKHRVEIKIADNLPTVRCSRVGVESAILNLALNARDAMPDGGKIAIEAIATFQNSASCMAELRISDTGVGMTPGTIERAFEPFFTTRSSGSGGIGLALVKRFARDAGGGVCLLSEPDAGTTAILRLPGAYF